MTRRREVSNVLIYDLTVTLGVVMLVRLGPSVAMSFHGAITRMLQTCIKVHLPPRPDPKRETQWSRPIDSENGVQHSVAGLFDATGNPWRR